MIVTHYQSIALYPVQIVHITFDEGFGHTQNPSLDNNTNQVV